MCLIDKKQFRIAEKDIPIFKVVFKKKYSPFRRTLLYKINYVSETVNEKPYSPLKIDSIFEKQYNGGYYFDYNYFFALTTKEAAEEFIKNLHNTNWYQDYSIVTGYIPEGTRYAIEESSGYICARKMILNL